MQWQCNAMQWLQVGVDGLGVAGIKLRNSMMALEEWRESGGVD
jgi:hypothetical protein